MSTEVKEKLDFREVTPHRDRRKVLYARRGGYIYGIHSWNFYEANATYTGFIYGKDLDETFIESKNLDTVKSYLDSIVF
jgi:hypothetical protein